MTTADMREVAGIFGTMVGMSFCGKQYELPWLSDEELRQIEDFSTKFIDEATNLYVHEEINGAEYVKITDAYKLMIASIEKRIIDNEEE